MRNYFLLPDSKIKCFLCKKIHKYQMVKIIGRYGNGTYTQFECDSYEFSLEIRFNHNNKILREFEIQDENCGVLRLSNIDPDLPVFIQQNDSSKISNRLQAPLFINDLEDIIGNFLKEIRTFDYEAYLG